MGLMESVESYLAQVVAAISPLPPERLSLEQADGAVLAGDVTAAWPLPVFSSSALDGYAVRAADVAGASVGAPAILPVAAEAAAGDTTIRELSPGTAIKIMTGAMLPAGTEAVVPVEWTDGGAPLDAPGGGQPAANGTRPGFVRISQPAGPGHGIRLAGGDARVGDLLLPAGAGIGPAQLGLLAAAGLRDVLARPRPKVTVISTGDELAEPGSPLLPGQIWESNSIMLAAAARRAGAEVTRIPAVRDLTDVVLAVVERAAAVSDLLITSGGVSMGGDHDAVKAALSGLGTVRFSKVAIQPGMPQGFGQIGPRRTPIFTLPGNPVSAFVSFHLFIAPALDALQNLQTHKGEKGGPRQARLAEPVTSPAGRRSYLRAFFGPEPGVVTPLTGQGSHQLATLARANALAIIPEEITELPAGATIEVLELP